MKLLQQNTRFTDNWIKILVAIILLLGIGLRFTNLDQKVYWIDEVHTSLRVSGYTRSEFEEQAPVGTIVNKDELQKFQRLTPERDFNTGVKAIASSEHSPLYYVLTRLGVEWLGSSIKVTRGVAAVISLFSFPCMYWLAQELFASKLVGAIAIALLAISPVHLLYAQEAREYSLLTVTILFSSWMYLRAVRLGDKNTWILYALSIALGLYTHPLAVLTFVAHGIYGAVIYKFPKYLERRKTSADYPSNLHHPNHPNHRNYLTNYFWASATGILLFSPWIWVFIVNGDGVGGWIEREISLGTLLQRWCLNLSSVFFDLQVGYGDRLFDVETGQDIVLNFGNPFTYILLPILCLIAYSLYYLVSRGRKSASLFIFVLIGVTALGLGMPDLISGGQRSTISRYIIPINLGVELAVGFCLASTITTVKSSQKYRSLWQLLSIILISMAIWCCINIVAAQTWWNKYSSYYNPSIAQIINQSQKPLIIGNTERISRLTSLSYILQPSAKFLLFPQEVQRVEIPSGFSDVYLFKPYGELVEAVQQGTGIAAEVIEPTESLWQIKANLKTSETLSVPEKYNATSALTSYTERGGFEPPLSLTLK